MNLQKYEHIIWDFNGTLLDDAWLCAEVVDSMLIRRKKTPLGLNAYIRLFDLPLENFYKQIGFDLQDESFEDLATEYISDYDSRRHECSLQPGAQKALEHFRQTGIGQSILSAYELPRLKAAIEYLDIADYFDALLGMDHHRGGSKAHLGKEFLNSVTTSPDQVLFVGDTVHDYQVARQMKVDCLLVAQGHQPKNRLKATNAFLCESLEEVFGLRSIN